MFHADDIQAFINSVSVLLHFLMNSASSVANVLLVTHNHHQIEAHFKFSPCLGLVVFMSLLCVSFFLILILLNQTHFLFAYFSKYLILVLDDKMGEETE